MFIIKGPRLAWAGAAVATQGVYVRAGDVEYLYTNSTDASLAATPNYTGYVPRIPLLTNDALDSARETFLQCSENPGNLYTGCPVIVKGVATECEESNAFGGSREVPCLDVKDADVQQPPPPLPEPQEPALPQPPPQPPAEITTGYVSIDGVWKKYMRVNGVIKQPDGADGDQYASEADIDRVWREAIHHCKIHVWANILGTVLSGDSSSSLRTCIGSADVKYGLIEGRNPSLGPPPPSP